MEELVRTAERILSGPFGRHAALLPERAWDGDKSTVLRCRLLDAAPPAPTSVIVKQSKHGAILEDWAASLFLEQVPHEPPLAPHCYGGDLAAQVIVREDLGHGEAPTRASSSWATTPTGPPPRWSSTCAWWASCTARPPGAPRPTPASAGPSARPDLPGRSTRIPG